LLQVARALHELPFQRGVKRVLTSLKIDDRRDKSLTMKGKVASVKRKLRD